MLKIRGMHAWQYNPTRTCLTSTKARSENKLFNNQNDVKKFEWGKLVQ